MTIFLEVKLVHGQLEKVSYGVDLNNEEHAQ